MIFASKGFGTTSVGYKVMNVVTVLLILMSAIVFVILLSFEVYRSIKFAMIHDVARQVEEEAVEAALRGRATRAGSRRPTTAAEYVRPSNPRSALPQT
jgi:hypothetical protein